MSAPAATDNRRVASAAVPHAGAAPRRDKTPPGPRNSGFCTVCSWSADLVVRATSCAPRDTASRSFVRRIGVPIFAHRTAEFCAPGRRSKPRNPRLAVIATGQYSASSVRERASGAPTGWIGRGGGVVPNGRAAIAPLPSVAESSTAFSKDCWPLAAVGRWGLFCVCRGTVSL